MKFKSVIQMILLLAGTALVITGFKPNVPTKTDARPTRSPVGIKLTAFDTQPPGEIEQIADIVSKTTQLQDLRPGAPDQIFRGVHAKAHGCVNAEFTINDNLDKQFQVGLFRKPGKTYDAKIRFSNATVLRQHDLKGGKNGSRGMAIKVMHVGGRFLTKDQGQKNQDFLMINTAQFAFQTVRAYGFLTDTLLQSTEGADPLKLLALANPATPAPAGFSEGDRAAVQQTVGIIINEIRKKPVRNPAQIPYFGAAPFLFGPDRVMKFSAAPCVAVEQTPFVGEDPPESYLRDALIQSMHGDEEVCYNFQIQVRNLDEIGTQDEIENASTKWPNEEKNYVNVARITIPPHQDIDSAEAQESCEELVFTPWHSLAAHQPVGGINRLRLGVYLNSALHRRISTGSAPAASTGTMKRLDEL